MNVGHTWDISTGSGITVAVIDTGIDTDHPEFKGIISEYSYNATEDKIVKDFVLANGEYDWSLVEDDQGHGTAVTGVIAAQVNGDGIVGIAPSVTIITIKAECDSKGTFKRTSDLVFGLYYAIERDVDIVNMSLGTYEEENPFAKATQLAVDSDVICVAAAGNDATTSLTWPAADPNVIGVGALAEDSWELAPYSNYGENVNVVAPGTVYTTLIGGKYGNMNGTSLASPTAAAAIALYLSQNKYTTFETVQEVVYASCYDLGSLGADWFYGYGAMDINALVCEEKGKITFDMLSDEVEDITCTFIRNHTLQNIPEPERLYSVFEGWYYDEQCTQPYELYSDKFTDDLTLYANWINEDDGIPYTYVTLDDGTVEIRSYTGRRKYITVPDVIDGKTVSSIGDETFKGENKLRTVNLPKNLKNIGRSAFEGCTNLTSFEIPEGVTTVGERAFYGNSRMYTVIFKENSALTTIGRNAFAYCGKLARIELPAKLSTVDGSAFYGDTSLTSISIRKDNSHFTSNGGVLFDKNASTIIAYPAGLRGEYAIPDSVTTIGDFAFAYAKITSIDFSNISNIGNNAFEYSMLEKVVIPDSLTGMGVNTFAYTYNLSSITIGSGLLEIPNYAFLSCENLKNIVIPENIAGIGVGAFMKSGLESVTFADNIKLALIGSSAFQSTNLLSVEIPASVATIENGAFSGNTNLSSVKFKDGSVLSFIGERAFAGNDALENITLPASVSNIGDYAFSESGLVSVILPKKLVNLGIGAFASCHSLTEITVDTENEMFASTDGVLYKKDMSALVAYPAGNARESFEIPESVKIIDKSAFCGSWNLTDITLPSELEEIGENAFLDVNKLSSISMPDSVIHIGRYAFANTESLSDISFGENSKLPRIGYGAFAYSGIATFRVPASVSTIAQGAFEACKNLISITFAENSKLESISAYMFDGCSALENITFEAGSALTSIQAHGIEGMAKLTGINLADTKLTNIDNFAFRFCSSLTTLELPDTLTNIGRFAFYGCKSFSELFIPKKVEHIGQHAFYDTDSPDLYFEADALPPYLDEYWDEGVRSYHFEVSSVNENGDWKYAVLASGKISIVEYLGSGTTVDMSNLGLGDIIAIGGEAFYASPVTEIVLPETLTTVQKRAFYGSSLKSVTIPESVEFIGREAFYNTGLERLSFADNSKIRVVEIRAFAENKSLGAVVTVPASLETLGNGAFENSAITGVIFEDGCRLTEIPKKAFSGTRIEKVVLPDSITNINDRAFSNNGALKSVSFGNAENIKIQSNAFYNTGLESVHIPANVTYIGEYAFVGLKNLGNFTVDANNPNYSSVDGILMNKSGKKLIAVPAARTGEFTVPATVEVIGFGAFENSKLTRVYFPENANILTLGYRAFYNSAITEIEIPASAVSIDYYAFGYCEDLTRVTFAEGNKLTGVYEGAFIGCTNLEDIILPDSIIEISGFAFYGCSSIESVPVGESSELMGIYDYAFAYTGLSGDFTTPRNLIDIGAYAFMGNKFTSVTVPDANTRALIIGIGAFEDCNNIEEITLPFIGASFDDTEISWFGYIFGAGGYEANSAYVPESLKKVILTEGISFVGTGAFWRLENIEEIDLPHSITMLYDYAFGGTTAKYELTNEISVENDSLGDYAIDGVVSSYFGSGIVGEVKLSDTVTYIELLAIKASFNSSVNLSGITINPDNPNYTTIDGVVYNKDVTELLIVPFSKSGQLVMPDTVKTIAPGALHDCRNLLGITLSSAITELESDVFYQCMNLKKIINRSKVDIDFDNCYSAYWTETIERPDGTRIYKEGETQYFTNESGFVFKLQNGGYTLIACPDGDEVVLPEYYNGNTYKINLSNNSNLKAVTVPGTVPCINSGAFDGCTALSEVIISEGVKHIENDSFFACGSIKSISLPVTIESIGNTAFARCDSLAEIIVDADNPYYCSADGILYDKALTKVITVPSGKAGKVTLKDGITTIGENAFRYCSLLTEITFPESVKTIEKGAFDGCHALESITIPENIAYLPDRAFYDCLNLKSVILRGNTQVDSGAFNSCYALQTLGIGENNTYHVFENGILYNKAKTEIVLVLDTISGEVIIPDTVTQIGTQQFYVLHGVTSIFVPKSVTDIGWGAFDGCSNLVSITVDAQNPNYSSLDGVLYNKAQTEIIQVPGGISGNLSLPESVSTITRETFDGVEKLSSITLPKSLVNIEDGAFYYCHELRAIYNNSDLDITFDSQSHGGIGEYAKLIVDKNGNKHYLDESGAFEYIDTADGFRFIKEYGKYTLISYHGTEDTVTLPVNINGNEYEIYRMTGVKNVIIPEGFTRICDQAFEACLTLKSITIPSSVTSIGWGAFCMCENLAEIVIPGDIIRIGEHAFAKCTALKSITISDNACGIYANAFEETAYYDNAENWIGGGLYIGKHLIKVSADTEYFEVRKGTKSIANGAFEGCYRLIKVMVGGDHISALAPLTNLKTLVISELPTHPIAEYFSGAGVPLTLNTVVLKLGVQMHENAFNDISGITICIESDEEDMGWDENYLNWHNGNKILYGDDWITADFYDENGKCVSENIFSVFQIIRIPWMDNHVKDEYIYTFEGFDIDGDGVVDAIPATSANDITARAIYHKAHVCEKGHLLTEWHNTVEPGCETPGELRRECERCSYVETNPLEKLGHSFTHYVSNNDATYTEDGTKTAKCDRCDAKDTQPDKGSALGLAQKFKDEMAALSKNAGTEAPYMELYSVLKTYASLSDEEKASVAAEYNVLQQMITAYNEKAQTANKELADATEVAFAPIVSMGFVFLAALWFLLKKKFFI